MADEQRAETYIVKIPYSVLLSIYQSLDADKGWEALAAETGYTFDKIKLLELEGARSQGSPARSLLWELGSRNVTVRQLYSHLNAIGRYREMKILEDYVNSPTKTYFANNGLQGLPDMSTKTADSLKGLSSPCSSVSKRASTTSNSSNVACDTLRNINQPQPTSDVNSMQYMKKDYPGKQMPIASSPSPLASRVNSRSEGAGTPTSIRVPEIKPNNPTRMMPPNPKTDWVRNMMNHGPTGMSTSSATTSSSPSGSSLTSSMSSLPGLDSSTVDVQMAFLGSACFSYSEIVSATNHFSEQNKLGEGAFGTVYFGVLRQNRCAVKKMTEGNSSETTTERSTQIRRELTSLLKFRHENIVTLYGYALDGDSLCLVYQFMPNGSLEDRLMCKKNTPPLVWSQRLNILLGACQGLNFLHTMREQPLIHGDIKSANILLDKHMEAKIGDLGQAQQASGREAQSTTSRMTHITRAQASTKLYGTKAYQSTEVQTGGKPSTKSDIFAMGVVVLEVFSGEQAYDERREGELFLAHYFRSQKGENGNEACLSKIDRRGGECPREVSLAILEIADVCTEDLKRRRPTSVQLLQKMVAADELYRQKTGIKITGMESMPGSERSCHLSHSSSPGASVENLTGAPPLGLNNHSIPSQPDSTFGLNMNSDYPAEKYYAMHLHHEKRANNCMQEKMNTGAGQCTETPQASQQDNQSSLSSNRSPIECFPNGVPLPAPFLLQQKYDNQKAAERKRISRLSQLTPESRMTSNSSEAEVLPQADPAKLAALEQFDRLNLGGNSQEKDTNSFQSDPQKLAALKQFDEHVHPGGETLHNNEEQGSALACDPHKLALLRQFDDNTMQACPAAHEDQREQQVLASDPRKLAALTQFDAATSRENFAAQLQPAASQAFSSVQHFASQQAVSNFSAGDMFPVSRVDYVVSSQREALEACSSMARKEQQAEAEQYAVSMHESVQAESGPASVTQAPTPSDSSLLCRRDNFFDAYSKLLEGAEEDGDDYVEDEVYGGGNGYEEVEENSNVANERVEISSAGQCSMPVEEQVPVPVLNSHYHPVASEQDESVLSYFKQRDRHYDKTFKKPQASQC